MAPSRRTTLAPWRREDPHLVVALRVETVEGPEERERRFLVAEDGLLERIVA